jgi:hypothetical protein
MAIRGGIPKTATTPIPTDERSEFISGAPAKTTYPWQAPRVRDDLMVQVNVKQPERLMLMVEWLAEQEGTTKRQLIEDMLREGAVSRLRKRGIRE